MLILLNTHFHSNTFKMVNSATVNCYSAIVKKTFQIFCLTKYYFNFKSTISNSSSKHSFSFQYIENGQLILSIPNRNGQNSHNDHKQTGPQSLEFYFYTQPLMFIVAFLHSDGKLATVMVGFLGWLDMSSPNQALPYVHRGFTTTELT